MSSPGTPQVGGRCILVATVERSTLEGLIQGRAGRLDATVLHQCAAYLSLLAKWNRRINLTAFDLDTPTDSAIDRLIVEALDAARYITSSDHLMIDIGSGGGSPAIPIKIIAPWLRVVMVESKTRKAAFLREAIRQLGLTGIEVDARRAEELLARTDVTQAADLITLRAVRLDKKLHQTIARMLRPTGRLILFGSGGPEVVSIPR